MIPNTAADESLRSRLAQFNKAVEETARRHGAPLVDLYKVSRNHVLASAVSATPRPSASGSHPVLLR